MILMKEAPGARFKNYILRVSRVGVERHRLFDPFDSQSLSLFDSLTLSLLVFQSFSLFISPTLCLFVSLTLSLSMQASCIVCVQFFRKLYTPQRAKFQRDVWFNVQFAQFFSHSLFMSNGAVPANRAQTLHSLPPSLFFLSPLMLMNGFINCLMNYLMNFQNPSSHLPDSHSPKNKFALNKK